MRWRQVWMLLLTGGRIANVAIVGCIRRADNSVIDIRPAEGTPPWAGGPRSKGPR